MLPCVIFEDADLLVVNKPAGMNTHAPSPYAGEGIYDWLRNREPGWAELAIIHRLDKETSGVIVFAKTARANKSLTEQFTNRQVRKSYVFVTDRRVSKSDFTVKSFLQRVGEKYVNRSTGGGQMAETRFRLLGYFEPSQAQQPNPSRIMAHNQRGRLWRLITSGQMTAPELISTAAPIQIFEPAPSTGHYAALLAEPVTGRTHQIRVHAAEKGMPVLGDVLYEGTAATRLYLHAAELKFSHPATGQPMRVCAPINFSARPRLELRREIIDESLTNAFRMIHGGSDGFPGLFVDRLGQFLLAQSKQKLTGSQRAELEELREELGAQGIYHKILMKQSDSAYRPEEVLPELLSGSAAPERFIVSENGLSFELSFRAGQSFGLFLDQRDNRRRLLTGYIAPGFYVVEPEQGGRRLDKQIARHRLDEAEKKQGPTLLNAFCYTCGFSVCAAKAGAHTTNVDLSKKCLEWGKRNFSLNGLDSGSHDFLPGDIFDWFQRLKRKERQFDIIVLDPPTFSRSKDSGTFRVEKDYPKLLALALPLLKDPGVLLISANAAGWPAEDFVSCIEAAVSRAGRKMLQKHYAPQPPDFPISRSEPAYLKTMWLRVGSVK